jgi:glycosyltransferase involved in cell wall biosynthesis
MSEAPHSVAVFVPSLEAGGAERAAVNLCNGLASRGVAVDLVLVRAVGPLLSEVDPSVTVVDLGRRRVLTALLPLRRYLRRHRPGALLSEMDHSNVIAVWARDLARVRTRVVVIEQTTASVFLSHERSIRESLIARFMRRAYRRADGIIAVSEGVRRDLARFLEMSPERIDVAPNPIVTPRLLEAREQPAHGWLNDGGEPVVVAVGRLVRAKDYPTLIRAMARVREQCGARLLILGEGTERPRLQALVSEIGLDGHVSMPGFVQNPAASVARSAAYVLSSRYEGLPSVVVEALPFGVPLIATDCPSGPREILHGGRYGRLVPVGDESALARGIIDALGGRIEPPSREAWAPFTVEAVTSRYLSILGSVTATGR